MKKILLSLILFTFISITIEANSNHRHFAYYPVSVQIFYDDLNPFGDWIYTPEYGYVWRPYFDYPEAFRPYSSNGRWMYTDYGWTWVSDYTWGWATFHYGRWYLDDYLGWMWIPGYEWAPAWVAWGSYEGYWGWAPLGPGFHISVGFDRYIPSGWWTFVHRRHFCSNRWNHYIYDRPVNVTYITNITNIYNSQETNSTSWYYGPRKSDVERHSGTRVQRVDIVNSETPENRVVSRNQVKMYRPVIERESRDARPVSYKPVENERRAERFQPRPASNNDPGKNAVRDKRDAQVTGSPRIASTPKPEQKETKVDQSSRPAEKAKVENKRDVVTQEKHQPAKETQGERPVVNTREKEGRAKSANENISNQNNRKQAEPQPGRVTEKPKRNAAFEKSNSRNTASEVKTENTREKPKTDITTKGEKKPRQDTQPVKPKSAEKKQAENKSKTTQRSR